MSEESYIRPKTSKTKIAGKNVVLKRVSGDLTGVKLHQSIGSPLSIFRQCHRPLFTLVPACVVGIHLLSDILYVYYGKKSISIKKQQMSCHLL